MFTNPVNPRGDDPFVVKYNHKYYYCYSIGRGVNVTVSDSLTSIRRAEAGERTAVYRAPAEGEYSREYWAPELHRVDGRWIIYVAADDGDNFHHRMYALGALTDDPCGDYEMLGKVAVAPPYDKWAIDGTVLGFRGKRYFVWSGWSGDVNVQQNLYIARMKDAVRLDSPRSLISCPEFAWETGSCGVDGLPAINEGPAALCRGGRTFLVYSASGSWSDDYCLGLLELVGDDPLDPRAWKKYPEPILRQAEGSFGPGHCSFTVSPDGSEDYVVYHANCQPHSSWGGRSLRMQKFGWKDGLPQMGEPIAPGVPMPLPSTDHKRVDTLLFDLDGTLLPITQEAFIRAYVKELAAKMAEHGYRPEAVISALWKGRDAMAAGDGQKTNEELFWEVFAAELGREVLDEKESLLDFYRNEFDRVKSAVDPVFAKGSYPSDRLIRDLRARGFRLILATNPLFPLEAIRTRLRWIGLAPEDFDLVTTYENSRFCKPDPRYFEDVLLATGSVAERCLMVGNDAVEDLAAERCGIEAYLLTDFPENADAGRLEGVRRGSLAELMRELRENDEFCPEERNEK